MVKRFDWLLVCLLFSIGVMAQSGGKQYNSYKGLVMAGYQGWFNTPGDGSGRGWHHYNGRNGFRPGSCSVDLWPEMDAGVWTGRSIYAAFYYGDTERKRIETL